MTQSGPPEGGWGDAGYPQWFARVTGVGSSIGQALIVPVLAVVTALIIGGVIIIVTDVDTLRLYGDSPGEAFKQSFIGVWEAYKALFLGAVGSPRAISETLFSATPLILAGLAVAIGFRAGLFNIGVNGQMLIGGMAALWVGFTFSLPLILHITIAVVVGIIFGALWGGITGFLKGKTGAHEVITTIMFNFIALFLVDYLLKTRFFQATGRQDPISKQVAESARFPSLFEGGRVHIGFLIALVAVFFTYWLLFKSSIGFEFRAVGFNPDAGRYAGMNVAWIYVAVMGVSGALAGIAGSNQLLGLAPYQALPGFSGNTGFDAIALALLGRSHPFGVLAAALLFGALRAGGRSMQGLAGIPLDLVLVMQALIIVFIAAPELVRSIYRVKVPEGEEGLQLTRGWGG
ncbi:MAG: ABC transporter permease [Acidimicrobiia bacterium]|nr:MAG: ABC transporter permease [Acidimicrobiia bacterium]